MGSVARRLYEVLSGHYENIRRVQRGSVRVHRSRRRGQDRGVRDQVGARHARPTLKSGSAENTVAIRPRLRFCYRVGMNYVSCSPYRVPQSLVWPLRKLRSRAARVLRIVPRVVESSTSVGIVGAGRRSLPPLFLSGYNLQNIMGSPSRSRRVCARHRRGWWRDDGSTFYTTTYSPGRSAACLSQAGLREGMAVADFGCGVGATTCNAGGDGGAKRPSVVGIDVSGPQLEQGRDVVRPPSAHRRT